MFQFYNQNSQKKSKFQKIVYNIMLFSMLHSTFVAPAQGILYAYFNKQEGLHYLGSSLLKADYNTAMVEPENYDSVLYKEPKTKFASKRANLISTKKIVSKKDLDNTIILSDIKEG